MSAGEERTPEPEATEAEPAGESRQMSERTAKGILFVIAAGAVWGIVAAFPWVAYVIVGVLLTVGWQKISGCIGRRQKSDAGENEPEPKQISALDIIEALHKAAAPNVFLADLADELAVSKETARALLENLGIRVRRAVRNGDDTGVGIHKDDLPPLPRLSPEDPETGVDQGQPTNQHGVRIERTDGGFIVYDLADTHRHHRVTGARPPQT